VQQFCREQMKAHASTAERLPIIETFFKTCLASISPIESVLDLACGLNPLALPWMPLADDFSYQSCDIYLDMLDLIQAFFDHFMIQGHTFACNLTDGIPREHAQVGFFLKSLPCLEQLDKSIGVRLLEEVNTDHILVSFPVHSLGGVNKGMPGFYREHFYYLIAKKNWKVQEFCFETELAFLVSK
jgi:16S rRNA (guanine(1405)-N(7))-methyltransferase